MTTTIEDPPIAPDTARLAEAEPAPPSGRRTLVGAVRSELIRITRWGFAGTGAALIVFFSAMATMVTFVAGEQTRGGPLGGAMIDLASSDGIVAGLTMAADLVGIVVLALWAAAVASDYTTGWIRVMVQAEPRRWRLLVGKFAALLMLTIVGTTLATAVSVALAPILAAATGVSTAAWTSGVVATVASTWFNLTLAVVAWGIVGYAVAVVTRSAVVAIAGGIAYLLVFEGLLGLVAESATTYLPGSVLGTIVAGGTASLAYGAALAVGAVYVVVAIGIVVYVFRRRDITS